MGGERSPDSYTQYVFMFGIYIYIRINVYGICIRSKYESYQHTFLYEISSKPVGFRRGCHAEATAWPGAGATVGGRLSRQHGTQQGAQGRGLDACGGAPAGEGGVHGADGGAAGERGKGAGEPAHVRREQHASHHQGGRRAGAGAFAGQGIPLWVPHAGVPGHRQHVRLQPGGRYHD